MGRPSKGKSYGNNGLGFITLPVVFMLLAFLLLYLALRPVLTPVLGVAAMFAAPAGTAAGADPVPVNLMQTAAATAAAAGTAAQEEPPATIPRSQVQYPAPGDQYGVITIEGTAINAPVFWGDDHPQLNAGVGTYTGGSLPGFGGTIMMAGHTGTYFSDMESVKKGAIITIDTHYGPYTYEVTDMAVKHHEDASAYDFTRTDENLILYTCYPFRSLGYATERYFVYASPVSGAAVDMSK